MASSETIVNFPQPWIWNREPTFVLVSCEPMKLELCCNVWILMFENSHNIFFGLMMCSTGSSFSPVCLQCQVSPLYSYLSDRGHHRRVLGSILSDPGGLGWSTLLAYEIQENEACWKDRIKWWWNLQLHGSGCVELGAWLPSDLNGRFNHLLGCCLCLFCLISRSPPSMLLIDEQNADDSCLRWAWEYGNCLVVQLMYFGTALWSW